LALWRLLNKKYDLINYEYYSTHILESCTDVTSVLSIGRQIYNLLRSILNNDDRWKSVFCHVRVIVI